MTVEIHAFECFIKRDWPSDWPHGHNGISVVGFVRLGELTIFTYPLDQWQGFGDSDLEQMTMGAFAARLKEVLDLPD